ncbi:hypothetical protein EGR_10656 [Echinococcus granulosus]|uniref:Uncharacterized protein n=1 Tax=Echinococcus granulosus TaxID=6210 RepID=W6U0F2_ECHGR|nr:hypothetical protein EGR_10656 [Echinococcus granulosus]EUB54488.1 hypothetical protein EGR_10656 [Echinococcus granulosus]
MIEKAQCTDLNLILEFLIVLIKMVDAGDTSLHKEIGYIQIIHPSNIRDLVSITFKLCNKGSTFRPKSCRIRTSKRIVLPIRLLMSSPLIGIFEATAFAISSIFRVQHQTVLHQTGQCITKVWA